tara:strand:+ start:156 stop:380 length:225 start_codon:yes stop_codon:yes gene_type:complete
MNITKRSAFWRVVGTVWLLGTGLSATTFATLGYYIASAHFNSLAVELVGLVCVAAYLSTITYSLIGLWQPEPTP